MRTVSFKSVLYGAARRLGLEPTKNLERNQAEALAEYISDRVEEAWDRQAWPEWSRAEERQYRNDYDNTSTYLTGAEVYYLPENKYYRAILGPPTGTIPTNTTYWQEATDLDQYVARDQSWSTTKIGAVWAVYRDDPSASNRPIRVNWWVSSNGIQVITSLKKVWIEFNPMPPRFNYLEEWSSTSTYAVDDVVYHPTTGQCYAALLPNTGQNPSTAPAYWQVQLFPFILSKYVKEAAYARALMEDEAFDKASVQEGVAEAALSSAMDQESESMRNRPFSVKAA